MSGAQRYSTAVEHAIREARARGLTWSKTLTALRAGTLDDDLGPVDIAERSFTRRWKAAEREQEQARRESPNEGPKIMHIIALDMARRDHGTKDPDELAEKLGWPLNFVRRIIDAEAKAAEHGTTVWEQLGGRKRRPSIASEVLGRGRSGR
jgi:hypothetical protein